MAENKPTAKPEDAAAARKRRQAEALRVNLRRRKDAVRDGDAKNAPCAETPAPRGKVP